MEKLSEPGKEKLPKTIKITGKTLRLKEVYGIIYSSKDNKWQVRKQRCGYSEYMWILTISDVDLTPCLFGPPGNCRVFSVYAIYPKTRAGLKSAVKVFEQHLAAGLQDLQPKVKP